MILKRQKQSKTNLSQYHFVQRKGSSLGTMVILSLEDEKTLVAAV